MGLSLSNPDSALHAGRLHRSNKNREIRHAATPGSMAASQPGSQPRSSVRIQVLQLFQSVPDGPDEPLGN